MPRRSRLAATATAIAALLWAPAWGQTRSVNTYGVPGLIDMPSAQMQPDGDLTTTLSGLSNESGRVQLSFQITPRLQGVFRYATIPDFLPGDPGEPFDRTYDRSFDLRYQVLTEGRLRPALTVGLQDFGGTSLYAGEYVVATKDVGDRLTVTGGIGWGRFGSDGGFDNPLRVFGDRFETRPEVDVGRGGEFEADQWFRGDAALFAGVQYQFSDRLLLKAEYSSDAYELEEERDILDRRTPFNFGFDYDLRPGLKLGGYALHGDEVGVTLAFTLNPKRSAIGSGLEGAPLPVTIRPDQSARPDLWVRSWTADPALETTIVDTLDTLLEQIGLQLVSTRIEATEAEIRFRNPRYGSQAQAVGRVARAMTGALPSSVETFIIVPETEEGLAGAAVILRRSDLERQENAPRGAASMQAAARLVDSTRIPGETEMLDAAYPRFSWALSPYVAFSTFDPDNPLRFDIGAQLSADLQPVRGLVFSGALRQRLVGNRDEADRPSNSVLPRVRSESFLFARNTGPFIPYLTGAYFFRPAESFYGRVSAGLLESQYGGASAELLWAPVDSRLAIGVEASQVRQRDFEMDFDFQDLDATTGFVSAYYDHGNGFHSRLDVGQYLAGDKGATYELTREFNNGWRIGAYATKTNVSSEDFGEGSFDKGIRLEIPLAWVTGRPSRSTGNLLIQPILRDGGARLRLRDRLYPKVRDLTEPEIEDRWGRFWR
ncbi:MAG: YjbH domain-containing protein [Pseudomonadota bacterium]